MFLCTFDAVWEGMPGQAAMPSPTFLGLLMSDASQEVAKLQMFLHFFERAADGPLQGEIVIDRVVGVAIPQHAWLDSAEPLLPLEMAPPRVGFETAPEFAHADFANMFIGGGVLSGGCVQEEIRFSICPELCLSMLLCPCMTAEEAIQIVGGEQFSAYKGYSFDLAYAGDHVDQSCRGPDGSMRTAVLAMDALDLRAGDTSLSGQLQPEHVLRELNKSLAAFTPVDAESLKHFPVVATGNWGCGAFGGCAPLKALLQWASASQCRRRLRYFPFDEDFGPELESLAARAVADRATVGQLLHAVWELKPPKNSHTIKLNVVSDRIHKFACTPNKNK